MSIARNGADMFHREAGKAFITFWLMGNSPSNRPWPAVPATDSKVANNAPGFAKFRGIGESPLASECSHSLRVRDLRPGHFLRRTSAAPRVLHVVSIGRKQELHEPDDGKCRDAPDGR